MRLSLLLLHHELPVHVLMVHLCDHIFKKLSSSPSVLLFIVVVVVLLLRYVRANSRSPRVLHTCKCQTPLIARNNYTLL